MAATWSGSDESSSKEDEDVLRLESVCYNLETLKVDGVLFRVPKAVGY